MMVAARVKLSRPSESVRHCSGVMSVGLAVSRLAGEALYAMSTSVSAVISYSVRRGR